MEIIIFGLTAFIAANHYYDGKYLRLLFSWKKYYQVAGIILGGLAIYWILKKAPRQNRNKLLATTNEYIKYMPIDRDSSTWLNPILDFTTKHDWDEMSGRTVLGLAGLGSQKGSGKMEGRILNSGRTNNDIGNLGGNNAAAVTKTKRSVSESKKKWVAAYQNWTCGECKRQLPAWFEIDHRIRLEHGGSNHVDNLVALCRDCHGKKTMIENL